MVQKVRGRANIARVEVSVEAKRAIRQTDGANKGGVLPIVVVWAVNLAGVG